MPTGHKDPGTIASEIKMMRMEHAGAFLVVEGVADMRFWRPRKHVACELVDGEGKHNVVGSLRRLDARRFEGVLGVVDDDYDSLMGIDPGTGNVVMTDAHDLECLLCRSRALEAVLAEFGVPVKMGRFEDAQGVDVRTGLLERALIFGRLRWVALRRDLNIDSTAIRVQQFVDVKTWQVDQAGLMGAVATGDSAGHEDLLAQCVARLPRTDPWRVVQGHDMIEILRRGLMSVLGDIPASVGPKQIAQVLRAGMDSEELRKTALWTDLRNWEAMNQGYSVLRD